MNRGAYPCVFETFCGKLLFRFFSQAFPRMIAAMFRPSAARGFVAFCASLGFYAAPGMATILWSDLGVSLADETGVGTDILGGALQRDDSAADILYFKFHVDPHSDVSTEEYCAGFQLYEGAEERLAIGNSQKAWAYSAFNTAEM